MTNTYKNARIKDAVIKTIKSHFETHNNTTIPVYDEQIINYKFSKVKHIYYLLKILPYLESNLTVNLIKEMADNNEITVVKDPVNIIGEDNQKHISLNRYYCTEITSTGYDIINNGGYAEKYITKINDEYINSQIKVDENNGFLKKIISYLKYSFR